jgi:hypothetical protein
MRVLAELESMMCAGQCCFEIGSFSMTTLAQVDKLAAKWFCDQMRRRGFAVEKKFIFWRKRGPLFDMFMSEILTGGVEDPHVYLVSMDYSS